MKTKAFIVVLLVLALLTINFSVAQEIDNSTSEDLSNSLDEEVLKVSDVNDTALQVSNPINTQLEVKSTTNFDVIGDYFKVKLSDSNGNPLKDTKVTFTLSGKNYNQNTDSNGIASLQLRLNDGTYQITTKFAGNSNYKASSLTNTVTMSNTRIVDAGLSNSEIQKIIDNSKANNVILFKGNSYSGINLVITKSLTLLSNVGTTLKSSSSSPVIKISGKSASLTTVKGFKIEGEGDGIKVDGSDYVKIISNDISCKGNGIVSLNTKYLNITKNNIVKNSKSGISIAKSSHVYIFDNKVSNNKGNGIEIAKSNHVYIHGNTIQSNVNHGVCLDKSVNGVNYGQGPEDIYINKNTITHNIEDGILVQNAGDNININSNSISYNEGNGISLAHIGGNVIQSNVITENYLYGIKFFDNYVKPKNQDISYNAIYFNKQIDVEAKETYYQENGVRLDIGDNWYTDHAGICPKISTFNIKFVVKQVGPNQFQASFLDSNGNIASLLPDRTLTYTSGGKTLTLTVKGGTAVFTVDANDGDLINSVVDSSRRQNSYDSSTEKVEATNGKSPEYTYPSIPNYQLYEDIGKTGGNGNGDGTGGSASGGNGHSNQEGGSTGNSTHSQRNAPANNANNPVNDVSQSYETQVTSSEASASDAGSNDAGDAGVEPQSVVKQIIIDEDEFFRVTGISLIVLLMILTVGFYYREDIKEMNSKR